MLPNVSLEPAVKKHFINHSWHEIGSDGLQVQFSLLFHELIWSAAVSVILYEEK